MMHVHEENIPVGHFTDIMASITLSG